MIRVADSRADLERCVEICNAVEPENPVQVEQFSLDRGTTLMHEGGGYAFVVQSSVADSAYAMVRVHPEARRRGIGSALLQAARDEWLEQEGRNSPVAFVALDGERVVGYARLYRELVSDMVEGNAAMRAVNERLGYRPLPPVIVVSGSASRSTSRAR